MPSSSDKYCVHLPVNELECPSCGHEKEPDRARCYVCRSGLGRKKVKYSELTGEQKKKVNARAYANVYLRRGIIERGACRDCGASKVEMHHEDYDKPIEVTWLCKSCHMSEHHVTQKTEVLRRALMVARGRTPPKSLTDGVCK